MLSFLASLALIAGTLLLTQAETAINSARSKKNKLTPEDVISSLNVLVNEARSKGEDTLNQLNRRLSNIPVPLGMSPSVKSFLNKTKKDLSNQVDRATKNFSTVEKKLSDIEQRTSTLAHQTDEYKYLYGKQDLDKIKDEAQQAINQANNLTGVETNV